MYKFLAIRFRSGIASCVSASQSRERFAIPNLIRFRLQTDASVTRGGWYLDDVEVKQSSSNAKTQAQSAIDELY